MGYPSGREAPTPLMLVIATEAENGSGFRKALLMAASLLRTVEQRYKEHCRRVGFEDNHPGFTLGAPCESKEQPELQAMILDAMSSIKVAAHPSDEDRGGAAGSWRQRPKRRGIARNVCEH